MVVIWRLQGGGIYVKCSCMCSFWYLSSMDNSTFQPKTGQSTHQVPMLFVLFVL